MQFRTISRFAMASVLAAALVPAGGVVAQAVNAISQKDKDEGAKAHPQLVADFGGAETGPLANYVATVGKKIAVQSSLSNSANDFTVTLLNSSVNNAFAIPGGYVYTTRQLVALMNSEAELAAVMGHEVGHVAARHSQRRQSEANKNQIIGMVGAVLAGVALGSGQGAQILQQGLLQGSQLLTLKYSRQQENEADALGVDYLKKAGYDPRAMAGVLQSLADQNALEARLMGTSDRVPTWASTHPEPAARVRTTLALAGTSPAGLTNRAQFLTQVNGMIYGDSPSQGFVIGRKFQHPLLKLGFEAPEGYYLVNGARSVTISGQGGKGQFSAGRLNGSLDAYVNDVFNGFGQASKVQLSPGPVQRTTVNGVAAAYALARSRSNSGAVDVEVVAYQLDQTTAYHFLTITPADSHPFAAMFSSFKRLNAAEVAALKPRRLIVVAVKKGDTMQSLAGRMAYSDAPLDRFRILNALPANASLAIGQKVKLVVY